MTVTDRPSTTPGPAAASAGRPVRLLAVPVLIAGLLMLLGGAATWFTVQSSLADERVPVSEDSERFAGDPADEPLTTYQETTVIEGHALEASGGKTYAELEREDPVRQTVMTASFLRASLFTSVVSFGVAAMAMGLGVVLVIVGLALMATDKALDARA